MTTRIFSPQRARTRPHDTTVPDRAATNNVELDGASYRAHQAHQRTSAYVIAALSVWLLVAAMTVRGGLLANLPAPLVVLPLVVALLVAVRVIPALRTWSVMLDVRVLVLAHAVRFVGIYFLVLERRGALPHAFATPAGIGDIVVAASAVGVTVLLTSPARVRTARGVLLVWNAVGLADLLFVVATALRLTLGGSPGAMAPLTRLPLGLLPTFIVPLLLASHVVLFARLRLRQRPAPEAGRRWMMYATASLVLGLGSAGPARAQLFGTLTAATVQIQPSSIMATVARYATVQVALRDSHGTLLAPTSDVVIAWTADNTNVVQVPATSFILHGQTSGSVQVLALAAGQATLTATFNGLRGTALITVASPASAPVTSGTSTPASLLISPHGGTLSVGTTLQLSATVRDASGAVLGGQPITWRSSAPAIATVSATGLVTGVASGSASISAMDGAVGAGASVVVSSSAPVVTPVAPPVVPVAAVVIGPATEVTLRVGLPLRLRATVQDATSAPLTGRIVTWASSAPAIARVAADGTVTGVAPGIATITATSEGQHGSATITVVRIGTLSAQ